MSFCCTTLYITAPVSYLRVQSTFLGYHSADAMCISCSVLSQDKSTFVESASASQYPKSHDTLTTSPNDAPSDEVMVACSNVGVSQVNSINRIITIHYKM